MKGITRGFLISIIGTLLILGNVIQSRGTDENQELLSTGITYLSWSKTSGGYLNENHSHFDFYMDFEISNPNNEEVIIRYPDLGLKFYANMTIAFRNKNFDSYGHFQFTALPAETEETYKQGITERNTTFTLSITKEDLTQLPDGNYDIWVANRSYDPFICNQTKLTINNGNPTIDYNPETSIQLGLKGFSMTVYVIVNLIILTILTKKQKIKKCKTHY